MPHGQRVRADAVQSGFYFIHVGKIRTVRHIADNHVRSGAAPHRQVGHGQLGVADAPPDQRGVEDQRLHKAVPCAAHDLVALRLAGLPRRIGTCIHNDARVTELAAQDQRCACQHHPHHAVHRPGHIGFHVRQCRVHEALYRQGRLARRAALLRNKPFQGQEKYHQLFHHAVLDEAVNIVERDPVAPDLHILSDHVEVIPHAQDVVHHAHIGGIIGTQPLLPPTFFCHAIASFLKAALIHV